MANGYGIPNLRNRNVFMGGGDFSPPEVDFGGEMGPDFGSPMIEFGEPAQQGFGSNFPGVSFGSTNVMDPRQPVRNVTPPAVPSYQPLNMTEMWDQLNKIYTPEFTSRDRYNRLLESAPQRQSPGIMRGIAGGLMALGSKDPKVQLDVMERAMYAPYMREMADWTARTEPFLKAADLENRANINERTLAGNLLTAQTAAERVAAQERYQAERNRIAQQKVDDQREIGLIRANAERERALGGTVKVDKNSGRVYSTRGGQVIDLGTLPGSASEAELANIRGEWGVRRAEALGEAAQGRAEMAGWTVFTTPEGKAFRINQRTGEKEWISDIDKGLTKPGTTAPRPETKAARLEREGEETRQIYQKYPEHRKFFVFDPKTETYKMIPRDRAVSAAGLFGNKEEVKKHYDYVRRMIEPDYVSVDETTAPTPRTTAPAPAPPRGAAPPTPRGAGGAVPPEIAAKAPQGAKFQHNSATGQYRYTTDGGRTWTIVR